MTARGPRRSISRPRTGPRNAETRKPNENAPAVSPRGQPNSSRIGGEKSENAGRALTPTPIVTNADATVGQPEKNRRAPGNGRAMRGRGGGFYCVSARRPAQGGS